MIGFIFRLLLNPSTSRIDNINQYIDSAFDHDLEHIRLDGDYYTTDKDTFEKIIECDIVHERDYRDEQFDCENFAFAFQQRLAQKWGINSVGVVIDDETAHAYNVIVFEDESVELYEPQSSEFVEVGDTLNDDVEYQMNNGHLII